MFFLSFLDLAYGSKHQSAIAWPALPEQNIKVVVVLGYVEAAAPLSVLGGREAKEGTRASMHSKHTVSGPYFLQLNHTPTSCHFPTQK